MNKLHTECLHAIQHPEHAVTKAVHWLKMGELVAVPTETVYGLAAPVFNDKAIAKIFKVKKRPNDNPLIIHCADLADVHKVAINVPPLFEKLAKKFLPGPLTCILEKHPAVPTIVSAGLETVAVRIPNHALTQAIIRQLGEPIVAPSANLSGHPSATQAKHVLADLDGKIASVVDGGPCQIGIESTIINILTSPPQILRPGIITKEELEAATGITFIEIDSSKQIKAIAPGMKYRHYAPKARVRLLNSWSEVYSIIEHEHVCRRKILANDTHIEISGIPVKPLSEHSLYAEFRNADYEHVQEILIVCDKTVRSKKALMNRLHKASEK